MPHFTETELEPLNKVLVNAPGTVLAAILTDMFGEVWVNWESQTIRVELAQAGLKPSDTSMDRLFALQLCLATDTPMQSCRTFCDVVNALAGNGVDFRLFDPAEIWECAVALREIQLHFGSADLNLSDEVEAYVVERAHYEGMTKLPASLGAYFQYPEKYQVFLDSPSDLASETLLAAIKNRDQQARDVDELVSAAMLQLRDLLLSLPLKRCTPEDIQGFFSQLQ